MTNRIGRYEIQDLLGDGGMGSVYRGRDPRFDRPVAIKVLHSHYSRDPLIVERFKAEAVIQAKLAHPHIVTVLDFIDEPGMVAMVMQYVSGHPLDEVIRAARGVLDPARCIALMDQILWAIGFAHENGIVHRDLKPSNVVVTALGGRESAIVMDFGIAKILGEEKAKTATGAKMGTLAYMSPEQIRSPKTVDQRSDVYSLGVMLYEMVAGRVPFEAESEFDVQRQIIFEMPVSPRKLAPAIPEGMAVAIEKAIGKEPSQRFQSCKEFSEAISVALREAPLEGSTSAWQTSVISGGTATDSATTVETGDSTTTDPLPEVWATPDCGLMWATVDNGCDVNWDQARTYSQGLVRGGYSDWRLPELEELARLHEFTVRADGKSNAVPVELTGLCLWSETSRDSASAWYFNCNTGKSSWAFRHLSYGYRALCARATGS